MRAKYTPQQADAMRQRIASHRDPKIDSPDNAKLTERDLKEGGSKEAVAAVKREKPDAFAALNEMEGLEDLKGQLESALAVAALHEARRRANKPVGEMTNNLVFEGPPGTGKTVGARAYAKALAQAGVIDFKEGSTTEPIFVETNASELKGEYVGSSAPLVRAKFEEAMGNGKQRGVLFIDEANPWIEPKNSYGLEALTQLLTLTENNRNVTVILGGYGEDEETGMPGLKEGLGMVDQGLPRRFPGQVQFKPYTPEQKHKIALKMLKDEGYFATPAASGEIGRAMRAIEGEAGDVRNFKDEMLRGLGHRIRMAGPEHADKISPERITLKDVRYALDRYRDGLGLPLEMPEER